MDYNEKYKRALERAKKLYEQGTITESLGYVFPELQESEDEKIRKELIEHIKANKEADYVLFKKFSPDDVIAWLEKQGEKKLIENVETKFCEGDKVVSNQDGKVYTVGTTYYVTGDGEDICLHDTDGNHLWTNRDDLDKNFHLWTIQDAKNKQIQRFRQKIVELQKQFDEL